MSTELASLMLAQAVMSARLIAAAYSGRDAVIRLAQEYPSSLYRFVNEGQWRAAVLAVDDTCYVGIAGSDDVRDWALNLSARHDPTVPMHSGYRVGVTEIVAELRRNGIRDLAHGRRVIASGHSAGGIMAQAMLHHSIAHDVEPWEVYTFGAPRGFSPDMANWVNASPCKCFRFTMPGDPVPHFPLRRFRKLFAGATYAHAGQEVRLHDDGRMEAERGCGIVEKIKFALTLIAAYSLKVTPFRVISVLTAKHSIDRYLRALKQSQAMGESENDS